MNTISQLNDLELTDRLRALTPSQLHAVFATSNEHLDHPDTPTLSTRLTWALDELGY